VAIVRANSGDAGGPGRRRRPPGSRTRTDRHPSPTGLMACHPFCRTARLAGRDPRPVLPPPRPTVNRERAVETKPTRIIRKSVAAECTFAAGALRGIWGMPNPTLPSAVAEASGPQPRPLGCAPGPRRDSAPAAEERWGSLPRQGSAFSRNQPLPPPSLSRRRNMTTPYMGLRDLS